MRLIDDIEAGEDLYDLWPTIKAALLAGEEMVDLSMYQDVDEEMQQARARFRAATEGTK